MFSTYFNPRTPQGVRQNAGDDGGGGIAISIHAPQKGCDSRTLTLPCRQRHFNPRTPCGVRPKAGQLDGQRRKFQSTHPIRGATPIGGVYFDGIIFQSTHPIRGATGSGIICAASWQFQSTHPMRGATTSVTYCPIPGTDFNPRTPCGVRHVRQVAGYSTQKFQSTHPMRGATVFP